MNDDSDTRLMCLAANSNDISCSRESSSAEARLGKVKEMLFLLTPYRAVCVCVFVSFSFMISIIHLLLVAPICGAPVRCLIWQYYT